MAGPWCDPKASKRLFMLFPHLPKVKVSAGSAGSNQGLTLAAIGSWFPPCHGGLVFEALSCFGEGFFFFCGKLEEYGRQP